MRPDRVEGYAWVGRTESDRLENQAIAAYLRQRESPSVHEVNRAAGEEVHGLWPLKVILAVALVAVTIWNVTTGR